MSTALQNLYETDHNQWLEKTITLLKQGEWQELDLVNLIEELESVGKSDRRALRSNLRILLAHLLKWEFQPAKRTGSWRGSVDEHRERIRSILEDSTSLKGYLDLVYADCYKAARKLAATETELPLKHFPAECPYAVDSVLEPEFLPE